MDPLSIAVGACSLAKFASYISKSIYDGACAVKDVDERLFSLSRETKILSQCLTAVEASLKDERSMQLEQSLQLKGSPQVTHFEGMRVILKDLERVLSRLETMVFGIKKEGHLPWFLQKSNRALKLSLNADDIVEFRDEIKVYIATMQLTLTVLNNYLLMHKDNNQASAQKEVEELTESVYMLQAKMKGSTSIRKRTMSDDGDYNENDDKQMHLEKYIEIAEELSSSATTYLGSVNGSVIAYKKELTPAGKPGFADEAVQMQRIAQWNGGHTTGDWMAEEKEDHAKMMITRRLDLARSKLTSKQHEAAEKLYTKCITEMELQGDYAPHGLQDVRMNLFHIYRNQKKFTEGLEILDILTNSSKLPPADRYLIDHLRAEVLLEQNKPDLALSFALQAMKNRYNMPDVSQHLYIRSSNLVADIHLALGEQEEAELYRHPISQEEDFDLSRNLFGEYDNSISKQGGIAFGKLSKNPSPSPTSAHQALLITLSQQGHNLNTPESINKALLWSIETQNDPAFHLCLYKGADVSHLCPNNWTPLIYAASAGSVAHVEHLIKLGAQVDGLVGTKWTPLMAAAYNDHFEIARLLIASGADVYLKSAEGEIALQIAMERDLFSMADLLRDAGRGSGLHS